MGIMEDWSRESTYSTASGIDMPYVVYQVTLKEKFLGTGSGNLTEVEELINQQALKGYRLHTFSTAHSDSKGFGGGDRIQATMVFEKINIESVLLKLYAQSGKDKEDIDEYISKITRKNESQNTTTNEDALGSAWKREDSFWVICPNCGKKSPENYVLSMKQCPYCQCSYNA